MKKPIKNLPASVRDRLARIAKDRGLLFQQALSYYAIERLLYRLAASEYSETFVLKGGLIFIAHRLPLRRPTRNIDLHAQGDNSPEGLEQIIRAVCNQPVEPDGMQFATGSLKGERINPGADVAGVRMTLRAYLGVAVIPMQIDVSFANVITPAITKANYPSMLGMPTLEIRTYPFETAIAEKLHAMVFLGSINDRLRDFYDIWLLSTECTFDGEVLYHAVVATFRQRNTPIPQEPPVAFSDGFAEQKEAQWLALLRTFEPGASRVPDFKGILGQLRQFLNPILLAAAKNIPVQQQWSPSKGWH